MKKLTLLFTLLITGILTIAMTMNSNSDDSRDAVVGEPAPEFEVMDINGNMRSLSEFEGQYVILEWLNHGCPFIQKHYNGENMQALQKKYTDQDVVWLSIISSAPGTQGYMEAEEARQSIEDHGASPTTILLDPEGTVGKKYDARVTPHMFIIDPDGVLRYNGAIDDKPSARPSSLDGAHNYIDAAMTSLKNGEEVEVKTNTPYGCSVKYGS